MFFQLENQQDQDAVSAPEEVKLSKSKLKTKDVNKSEKLSHKEKKKLKKEVRYFIAR